jgi:hypothetical protein
MKKTLNININKDDQNINDYLICWSELEERPNKISIFHSIDEKKFTEIIDAESIKYKTITSEIYPSFGDTLENRKCLIKLDNDVFISYVVYDYRSEDGFVGDIIIYFPSKSKDFVEDVVSQIESSFDDVTDETQEHSFFCLGLDNSGFEMLPINYLEADYENIDLYFNDEVLKSVKKLTNKINQKSKGLSIIYGEKGVGKSTLATYISKNLDKRVVFIPSTMVETAINAFDFRSFLLKNKNLVLVIDDCESFTTDIVLKTNNFVKNLVQIVDGIDSDNLNSQILLIFNLSDEDEIEENFIECNNLLDIINVDYLNVEKSKELSKILKNRKKIKKDTKLIDIIQKKRKGDTEKSIGFE